ncbi:NLP P60 [Venturia nashicola]|uniref:NLP P60 n=1 Tax=Venturia nashicola TaxID=86259 RepID=A0A4Z1NBS8_9PEZI|nr:NLP P60 [Venturia nashicola]TLD14743.1 NLP P60 [Venturia nashicola]
MKISSLVLASALLLGKTVAQSGDTNKAVQIEPPAILPALQVLSIAASSSPNLESVWVKVGAGINTECKTCPNSLCSIKNFYGSLMMFRATCWTSGQKINATDMWLHSEERCFVTLQDTLKYWRNYTEDLQPCKNVPKPAAAPRRMSAKAETDCKRCPNDKCETMQSYARRSEVSITCRAQGLPNCLETCVSSDIPSANATTVFPWVKTTANCYVKSSSLAQTRFKITSTTSLYYPVTTTVVIHKNPCEGPDCPPLIWAFTPPAATTTAPSIPSNATQSPTTLSGDTPPDAPITDPTLSPNLTLAPITLVRDQITDSPPSSSLTISYPSFSAPTITSATSPDGTAVPASTPIITLSPTTDPEATLTPTTNPGITLTPTTNSTNLPKCSCEPLRCEGSGGSNDQAVCTALAAEKCAKTCPAAAKATQAAMEPFQPLMPEGGRPPPNQAQAPSQEQRPPLID